MDPTLVGILALVGLIALLLLGLPIAFSMLTVGFLGLIATMGPSAALNALARQPFSVLLTYLLTVVPLFVLMGMFAYHAGISEDLYDSAYKWLRRLPGGLAHATVAGCALFAATTGSSLATVASMAKVSLPAMEKYGYDRRLAVGTLSASGTLGILIPPSIPMIIYAYAADQSVGALFLAGFIPGIISALVYMGMITIRVKLRPSMGPPGPPATWRERLTALRGIWGVMVLFLLVMGSIYFGVATPTEAGAIGAFGAFLLALRKRLPFRAYWNACMETVTTMGMIFAIFIGTTFFTLMITSTGLPMDFTEYVNGLDVPAMAVLAIFLLLYIPMGMFLDTISMILLSIPIMWPTLEALGFNGIWFGIIAIKFMEVSLITPPVALNVYIMKSLAPHVPLKDIYIGVLWFFVCDLLTIALLVAFPIISLWLPNTMWTR